MMSRRFTNVGGTGFFFFFFFFENETAFLCLGSFKLLLLLFVVVDSGVDGVFREHRAVKFDGR